MQPKTLKRVLVVDDNRDVLGVVRRALRGKYEVTPIDNTTEAISHLSRNDRKHQISSYGGIITDIDFPNSPKNGIQFYRTARALEEEYLAEHPNRKEHKVPVLFMSGGTSSPDGILASILDHDPYTAFIPKPFDHRGLITALDLLLRRHQ